MTWYEKMRFVLSSYWFNIKSLPCKIKRRFWNKRILFCWYRLYIRKDESHRSLDMDTEAMLEMNEEDQKKYITDLVRRRVIAHQRDIAK